MKTFKTFLLEKTYSLDRDVHFLFKKAKIDELLKYIKEDDLDSIFDFLNSFKNTEDGQTLFETDTGVLTNRNSKTADKLNHCDIRIGIFKGGSYYHPKGKTIQVSINQQAFKLLLTHKTKEKLTDILGDKVYIRFKNEFTEANIKGSIYHELTHWLDDSINNNMLTNRIPKGHLRGKHADVNHTEFEINSQIHKIKQLKQSISLSEFDKLTWGKFFQKLPSLMSNFKNFRNDKEYDSMIKNFVSRLNREKLLPKGLRSIPSRQEMLEILRTI